MATINPTDVIFATLTQRGSEIANVKLSGITSVTAILKLLLPTVVKGCVGVVTFTLRNSTQGWSQRRILLI